MAASMLVLNPTEVETFSSPMYARAFHHCNSGPRVEDIQIFLVTLGSNSTVIPMRVLSSDTIASVKMRIQAFKGFYTNRQRLVHAGRELRGDNRSLIRDCGVGNGEVLHLVLRLSDLIDVKVKTVTGTEYTFKVRRNQQVKYLKQRISEKEGGLALDEQQLVFRGKRLEDNKRIFDLHTEVDVIIHLVVRKSAKVRSRSLGKDIELSVSAAELDSLIDNFSPLDVQETSLAGHLDNGGLVVSQRVSPAESTQPEFSVQSKESISYGVFPDYSLLEPYRDFVDTEVPDILLEVMHQIRTGLKAGHSPVLALEGSGGTYFMKDGEGRSVGVFKPVDEEPEAVNNPRSSPRSSSMEGLKSGIFVGEGAMREVAAYLLDHPVNGCRTSASRNEVGFSGVPPTMMVQSSHRAYNYSTEGGKTKVGSLQEYIHAVSNCEDMGPARFPVDEVHKISVLDMRLANTDRNGGNVLVYKQGEGSAFKLVPIDHGYCLPDKFEDCTFGWLYWAQAKRPFRASTLKYIAELDADRDIGILGAHGIVLRPECARVLRVATMLLKKGAAAGLTPFAIGSMMSREQFDVKSVIETMLETAEASVSPAASENVFVDSLSGIMDQYLQIEI